MKSLISFCVWLLVCKATGDSEAQSQHHNSSNTTDDALEGDEDSRLTRQRRGPIRAAIGAALGVGAGILGYKLIRSKYHRDSSEEYGHRHRYGGRHHDCHPHHGVSIGHPPIAPIPCVQPVGIQAVHQPPPPQPRVLHEHIHEHHQALPPPPPVYYQPQINAIPIEAGVHVKAHIVAPPPVEYIPAPTQAQPVQPIKHIVEKVEFHVQKPIIKPTVYVVQNKCQDKHKECNTYIRQCTRKSIVTVCPKTCGICT